MAWGVGRPGKKFLSSSLITIENLFAVCACRKSPKFGGRRDPAPLGRGRGWYLKTRYSPHVAVGKGPGRACPLETRFCLTGDYPARFSRCASNHLGAGRISEFLGTLDPTTSDGGVADTLETRYSPHVLLHQLSSVSVKPFGRGKWSQKFWGRPIGTWTRPETRSFPTCVTIPTSVALDQIIWAKSWKSAQNLTTLTCDFYYSY